MRLATRAWCVSSASALYASRVRPRVATRTMATWVDADEASTVQANVQAVRERVGKISETATLIAVSKLKPLSHVKAAFDAGQRDFGENPIRNGPVLAGSTSNAFEAKRVTGPARLRREWNSIRANSKNLGREARIGPSLIRGNK